MTDPEATFWACFGAAFLVWHPTKYAEMLAERMNAHGAWLVNTGWSGGGFGKGQRMRLGYTRAIIDAIHAGQLDQVETVEDPIFGLAVPTTCPGCPDEVLVPKQTWDDPTGFDEAASKLAGLFHGNFAKYADVASEAIQNAGPKKVAVS